MNFESKKSGIVRTAARLFIEQGYENTGMRQIAEESGVSLGLINYHFGSKKELGILLVQSHVRALQDYINKTNPEDDRLRMLTLIRLNYIVFNTPRLKRFYEDTMKNDIYLEAIVNTEIKSEQHRYLSMGKMYWLLGDSYIPVHLERALVLCPFTDLLDMDVPDLIFRYFIYGYLPGEPGHDVEWYLERSRQIALQILADNPDLYDIFYTVPQIRGANCS